MPGEGVRLSGRWQGSPPSGGRSGVAQAERLLWRAGFGPRDGEAESLARLGSTAPSMRSPTPVASDSPGTLPTTRRDGRAGSAARACTGGRRPRRSRRRGVPPPPRPLRPVPQPRQPPRARHASRGRYQVRARNSDAFATCSAALLPARVPHRCSDGTLPRRSRRGTRYRPQEARTGKLRRSGPMYSADGRMILLSECCSSTCAAWPAILLAAKSGVNRSVGTPRYL